MTLEMLVYLMLGFIIMAFIDICRLEFKVRKLEEEVHILDNWKEMHRTIINELIDEKEFEK